MWALGFQIGLQDRKEAFESKHILLSFLCLLFKKNVFPFSYRDPSYRHHILLPLPFAWKTNISVPNVIFFQNQRHRAKEIRWGHGYLDRYKLCVEKRNLKQIEGRRWLMVADSDMRLMTGWTEMSHKYENTYQTFLDMLPVCRKCGQVKDCVFLQRCGSSLNQK